MATSPKFFPLYEEKVPASGRGQGWEYRVAVGHEYWDNCYSPLVQKIQLIAHGKIQGRKVPSFPLDSDDFKNCSEAMNRVMGKWRVNSRPAVNLT